MWLRFEGVSMIVGPYAEEADASLQAEFAPRDPIAEFYRGEITLRTLRILTQALPPTSALIRAQRGHAWNDLEYLVMAGVNEIRLMRAEAPALAGGPRPKKPELIEPPTPAPTPESEAEEQQRAAVAAEFAVAAAALFPND